MTTPPRQRIPFLTLPLELRREIYRAPTHSIPPDPTTASLAAAHPSIPAEMYPEHRPLITTISFHVTHVPWKAPEPNTFPKLRNVKVAFEQIPAEIGGERERGWEVMRGNLERFVAWLKEGNQGVLGSLEVGVGMPGNGGEETLFTAPIVKRVFGREVRVGRCLAMWEGRSVMEGLLMPLGGLGRVEVVRMFMVFDVGSACKMTRRGYKEALGREHAFTLKQSWQWWLEGERRGSWKALFDRCVEQDRLEMYECQNGGDWCDECECDYD